MKRDLYIIGAGSVGGHVVLNLPGYSKDFELKGFFDDDPQKQGTEQFGLKVLGPISDVFDLAGAAVIVGIAFPKTKRAIIERISGNRSLQYPTLVHQKAWVSDQVEIGRGCIVYPGTSINYGSLLQDFVVLNMNCALGHHTRVGVYSSFAPGVNTGGHTLIEEAVDVGIGASTLQDVRIGANSIVGGKSMVIRDVSPETTVVGVPAKVIS